MPITMQPIGGGDGAELADSLRELKDMDYVRIRQKVEICHMMCCKGCTAQNSYSVLTANNRKLFAVKEDSSCCCRGCCSCCPSQRPLDLNVKDASTGDVVVRYERPLRCQGTWCFCCCCLKQKMRAFAPSENEIGSVDQKALRSRKFNVSCADDGDITIEGTRTWCVCTCCWGLCCRRSQGYKIMRDGEQIGQIRKEHHEVKENLTDADNFYMTFPRDLHVNTKLTLLGGVFLLDYMFYEGQAATTPPTDGDGDDD